MRPILLLLMCPVLAHDYPAASLEPVVRFARPTGPHSLTRPFSMASDDAGRLYILDSAAKTVFVWQADGTYLRNFAQAGEGPGEIQLEDLWGAVTVTADRIYVLDNRVQKLHAWHRDFTYDKTVPLPPLGRITTFTAHGDGFLVVAADQAAANMRLLYLNPDLSIRKELAVVDDAAFKKNEKGGWDFKPYADTLIAGVAQDAVWWAVNNETAVRRVTLDGRTAAAHVLPILPEPVKQGDVSHFRTEFGKWAGDNDKIFFPKNAPTIDGLLPLADGYLIAARYQMDEGLCKGLVVSTATGRVVASIAYSMGSDLGFADAVKGKVAFITADAEGLYDVTLNKLVLPPNAKGEP